MRAYKIYKDYDKLELTIKEQFNLAIYLDLQSSICTKYLTIKNHPWLYSTCEIKLAKKMAQSIVKDTWGYLQEIFPGLDDSMAIFQEEHHIGKRIDCFYVATMTTALEKLSKQDNSNRVFTDEWEQMIKEYKEKHEKFSGG